MKTARDIERAQAVTRWVEGCKERSRGKTRGPGIKPTDAEFVAEHILLQAEWIAELLQDVADRDEVIRDKRRLARELDVALNGEDGAAEQPSLCDLVGQMTQLRELTRPIAEIAERAYAAGWEESKRGQDPRHAWRNYAALAGIPGVSA